MTTNGHDGMRGFLNALYRLSGAAAAVFTLILSPVNTPRRRGYTNKKSYLILSTS